MSLLYDFMYWITTLQLWGNRLNILGLIWLVALTYYTFREIRKPITDLRAQNGQKFLGPKRLFILSIIPVILLHFITDETFTFMVIGWGKPIDYLGKTWSWGNLLAMKFDVYLSIAALILMMIMLDFHTRIKFTKYTALFIGFLLALYFQASISQVGDFTLYEGVARMWIFWIYYPLTYLLLGLLYYSLLKRSSEP